ESSLIPPDFLHMNEAGIEHVFGVGVFQAAIFGPASLDHRPHEGARIGKLLRRNADCANDQQHGIVQSETILTRKQRWRGPSNSQKKIPCQRPSSSRPPVMKIVTDEPTSVALMCESELPSAWRNAASCGIRRSRKVSMSEATSRSADSL